MNSFGINGDPSVSLYKALIAIQQQLTSVCKFALLAYSHLTSGCKLDGRLELWRRVRLGEYWREESEDRALAPVSALTQMQAIPLAVQDSH